MLGALRRPHGHGGRGVGGGALAPSALVSWGLAFNGINGGGYAVGGGFNFPQGVVTLSNVRQVSIAERITLALLENKTMRTVGTNFAGQQGLGTIGGGEERSQVAWAQILGGVPLYQAEHLEKAKTGVSYYLPVGPVGPVVPPIAQVAAATEQAYALTVDGRVLSWGDNLIGQLGNGWQAKSEDLQAQIETGNFFPQRAPFWVLTGGPAQSDTAHPGGKYLISGSAGSPTAVYGYDAGYGAGTAANVLTGVRQLSVAHEVAFYLKGDDIYYSGRPAGAEISPYAVKDPAFTCPPGLHVLQIAAGKRACAVLLSNGTVEVFGINSEGRFGNGIAEGSLSKRDQAQVQVSLGVPLTGVAEIGAGEYSFKARTAAGELFTWGSNVEGQQGLGLPFSSVVLRATKITSLGTSVAAIDCGGFERGHGTFGGDTCIALMKDGTVRTWGINYDIEAGGAEHGEGTGALGDNTFMTRASPVQPDVSDVVGVAAGQATMFAIQRPGTPATPSIKATSSAPKKLLIEWQPVPGTVGVMPVWRAAENWSVRYRRLQPNPETGKQEALVQHNLLGAGVFSYLATIAPAAWPEADEDHEVIVVETFTRHEPVPTGGAVKSSDGSGHVTVAWAPPAVGKEEPGYYVEWQRQATYLNSKGKPEKEHYWRSDLLSGSATGYTIDLNATPNAHGLPVNGTPVNVVVVGSFEGSYQRRETIATVIA